VKFTDFLKFKNQTLDELHAKAVSYARLTPRLQTDSTEVFEEVRDAINNEAGKSLISINTEYTSIAIDVNQVITNCDLDIKDTQIKIKEAYTNKKDEGIKRNIIKKNEAKTILDNEVAISKANNPSALLDPLQSANQFHPLSLAFKNYTLASLPFRFRVCSRKNEAYGQNNWATELEDSPQNFHDLLLGTTADEYQSDLEPDNIRFLQGDGTFAYTNLLTGYNTTTQISSTSGYNRTNIYNYPIKPLLAIGAFILENETPESKVFNLPCALSCHNYAAVFIKIDDIWTPLYLSTTRTASIDQVVEVTIPANKSATIIIVSTPYLYRYESGTSTSGSYYYVNYTPHTHQFLQWGVFNIRALLNDGLKWRY
jgi:hypothetical protein